MIDLAKKFASAVLPGVIRPLRVLWNEMIAFVFFALAAIAAPNLWRSYRQFNGEAEGFFRLLLTGIFIFVMLSFGFGSIRRAKKISKS